MGKKKAAGDEQICRKKKIGKWKCKNVSSDNKLRFCEKHKGFEDFIRNKLTKKKEEKLKNGEGAGCSATGVETRGSKSRKKVTDQSLDETGGIQPPSTDTIIQSGSADIGKKRDNVETTQGSGEIDFTDSLTENPSLITSNKLSKKNKEMEKKKLHPDEQYCCQTGKGWRCKNFRMSHGAAADDASVPKTNYCEEHYNYYAEYEKKRKKKRNGDGGGACAGCSTATGPVEIRHSKRKKTATEEDETEEIQPATSDNTSDTIIEGGSVNISRKRKNVETTEESGERIVESESLENYKSKCFESSVELEKMKAELKKKNVELEKMRVEYTKLKGKLAEVDETSKSNAKDEDATKYWKNKCSDLESLVLRLELENSTMRCEASRVSNFESLVPRNGHENSILRCSELRNSERIIESEAWGLQDGGGNLHLPNQTENVDERKGWGCLEEERPPQDHLEKPGFVNLVSDVVESEYSGSHGGMHGKSEDSHSHGEILGESGDS